MKEHMLRLIVPSVLGCVAFGLNSLTINQAIEPIEVLAVTESVPLGGRLGESMLKVVTLPGRTQGMRKNLVRAVERGTVLERKVVRRLEADQILLYSDLDEESERPTVPDRHGLIPLTLDRVLCPRDLIQKGSRVWLLVRAKDGSPGRIGPFEVFEGPSEWSDEGPNGRREGARNVMTVLVDQNEPEPAGSLRDAIAHDTLRAIEVEAP
jgi:hypothetical protein